MSTRNEGMIQICDVAFDRACVDRRVDSDGLRFFVPGDRTALNGLGLESQTLIGSLEKHRRPTSQRVRRGHQRPWLDNETHSRIRHGVVIFCKVALLSSSRLID